MKAVRYSKQREIILTEVQHRKDHPTADMVFQSLKGEHPELSLGTVYRNLNLLVDLKEINKLDIGDGLVRFDGNLEPHLHFCCEECKAILDYSFDTDQVYKMIQIPHTIQHLDIICRGICETCKEAN